MDCHDSATNAEADGLGKDEIDQEPGAEVQVGNKQRDDSVEKDCQQKRTGETPSVRTVLHVSTPGEAARN